VHNRVAVEKLASQESAESRSRQDALQTTCQARLDIFYAQICAGFLDFEFLDSHSPMNALRGFRAPSKAYSWVAGGSSTLSDWKKSSSP
jgi:hypothetical protein